MQNLIAEHLGSDGFYTEVARHISLNYKDEIANLIIDTILSNPNEGIGSWYLDSICSTIQSKYMTQTLISNLRHSLGSKEIFSSIVNCLQGRDLSEKDTTNLMSILSLCEKDEKYFELIETLCFSLHYESKAIDPNILINIVNNQKWDRVPQKILKSIFWNVEFSKIAELLDTIIFFDDGVGKKTFELIEGDFVHYFDILLERFPNNNWTELWDELDIVNIEDWKDYWWLEPGDIIDLIAKEGNSNQLQLLENYKNIDEGLSYCVERAKQMILARDARPLVEGGKIITKTKDTLKYLIKDHRGYAKSRLYGFYMGLSKGAQPDSVRRGILDDLIVNPPQYDNNVLVDSRNLLTIKKRFYHRIYYLIGDGTYSDWNKRIISAEKYINEKPWHPWGYYAFDILNRDRLCVLKKYGPSIGLLPIVRKTNIEGMIKCDIINIFDTSSEHCPLCKSGYILPHPNGVKCWSCDEIITQYSNNNSVCDSFEASEFDNYNFKGKIFGKLDNEGDELSYISQDHIESVTKKQIAKMEIDISKIGIFIPIYINDHLAPMYADIEEMSGIGGDSAKRHDLK